MPQPAAQFTYLECCCRQWLEEKARNRYLEQRSAQTAVYEVEAKTGRMKVRQGRTSLGLG